MNYHQQRQVFLSRKKKWNKKIWIAKKIGSQEDGYGYEVPIYDRPKMYMMNVQPISSSADIQEFGERAKQIQKAVIEYKRYIGQFKEFDVAYLDGITPFDDKGEMMLHVNELNSAPVNKINNIAVKELSLNDKQDNCGRNANYRLYPPRNQNKCIVLYFERLTSK